MGVHKRFDKKLFEENDKKAKGIAIKYYKDLGYNIEENSKRYGPDLLLHDKDNKFIGYVECEKKNVWKEYEFPYDSVQFPERKKKYVLTNQDCIVTFFMVNKECSRALIVDGNDLINSPLEEVSNKYIRKGEYFFKVDLKKVEFVDIK